MTLIELLKADLLAARKARDTLKINVLTPFVGDLETAAKNSGKTIEDLQVVAMAKSRVAAAEDTLEKTKGLFSAQEYRQTLTEEIQIYNMYVPQQLTEDEIRAEILALNEHSTGKVQAHFKAKFPGRYSGATVMKIMNESKG